MNEAFAECPVCFKNFLSNNIENHVQKCLEKQTLQNPIYETRKRKCVQDHSSNKVQKVLPWSKYISKCDKNVLTSCSSSSLQLSSIKTNFKEPVCAEKISPLRQSFSFDKPLSDIARPTSLDNFVGQSAIVGKNTTLYKLMQNNLVPSMILWGPPGSGKTTLAHIISHNLKCCKEDNKKLFFSKLNATDSGKADLQTAIKTAMNKQKLFTSKTILFIDEIHRFNKLQQDSLLPSIENGTIILIGATTENPSFVLNSALLSRCKVIVLKKLEASHIKTLLVRALKSCLPQIQVVGLNEVIHAANSFCIDESSLDVIADMCDGDARVALNTLQTVLETMQCTYSSPKIINSEIVKDCLQRTNFLYDRAGDQHYDFTSALHKSIRGSDGNAALYWLTRMLLGGEDPRFIARRLIRVASEDIGLADPSALTQAVSCFHACQCVGMPECDVSLAQCVVYLARAPKSTGIYSALQKAKECIQNYKGPLPTVPLHLRNAPTKLMKDLGYGSGYKYKLEEGETQSYLPNEIHDINFFQ